MKKILSITAMAVAAVDFALPPTEFVYVRATNPLLDPKTADSVRAPPPPKAMATRGSVEGKVESVDGCGRFIGWSRWLSAAPGQAGR